MKRDGSDGSPEARIEEAEAALAAGQLMRARALAVEALVHDPDEPRLLRVAGKASLELELDDAARYLRSLVQVAPDDAAAWRDLAFAAMEDGDLSGSAEAFAKVLDLAPDDIASMIHLAYARHALGQTADAVQLLATAAGAAPERTDVLRSLAAMAKVAGDESTALSAARRLAEQDPKDVLAALDVAELLLAAGDHKGAAAAFARLRKTDRDEGHEVYACHGQVEALVLSANWRQALDAAIDATRVDRHQLTTDLLAFIASKLFGDADREARPWDELHAELAVERSEHRRVHEEAATL